ncbi:MAG TPA: ATP-binding cassette domain-containing protein, partial [Humisphaera sp.]|nr:ATP-binding cassette domain-containing protein [Humisphaera sp.]
MTMTQDTSISAAPISLAPGLSAIGITKKFGSLVALDNVSMTVRPGSMHALLGGNGAGKSTLVKCIMGYYLPDAGQISLGDKPVVIRNPREALKLGIGMVYQHFTLVPNMTVAENLVLSRGEVPAIIDWKKEYADLRAFMKTTPFFIPIGAKVSSLAAGQKQKLEICQQLYLKNKVLFLDEPTSVLTPGEADELLTMLKERTTAGDLTVLMITHKFREVMKFADEVTVLRTGRFAGKGMVKELTPADMSAMMIGSETTRTAARDNKPRGESRLHINGLHALDDIGLKALEDLNLEVHSGEIVGIAGVSGNGQSKLVEVLAGQRGAESGGVKVHGETYGASRAEIRRHKVNCLPEEPLKNTCVGSMSVAQNMAMRNFDRHPHSVLGFL